MTPEELEEIREVADSLRAKLASFEEGGPLPVVPAGRYVGDVDALRAEVERLRGVVEARDRQIERMALRYGMRQEAALEGRDG